MSSIEFVVRGLPAPQGSKRAFRNPHTGRIAQVESSRRVAPWRSDVRDAALAAMGDRPPLAGPLYVSLNFALPRPRSHYRSGRHADELRPSAPAWPDGRPDVDKLSRACLDAMTAIVWADDAQVVTLYAAKWYANPVHLPGCRVLVGTLDEEEERCARR